MDQRTLYDRLVDGWDGSRDESAALLGRDRFVIDDIRRQLGPSQTVSIAELSIGDGRMTTAILAGLPCARLTCGELSEIRIRRVREAIQANPELVSVMPDFVAVNFDTQFDRLPTDTFNVVIALDIMEHVFDIFGFLDHCHRIARQGALFYLRVPNIAYVRHRLRLLVGRIPVTSSWFGTTNSLTAWHERRSWDDGHLHLFTIPILHELLEETGFVVEKCRDPGTRLESLRRARMNLFFSNPLLVAHKR